MINSKEGGSWMGERAGEGREGHYFDLIQASALFVGGNSDLEHSLNAVRE